MVSSWLKNTSGAENLLDCAELENLMNVKGDERYCQEDGELIWQAKGADIYYQGESSQEAPVEVCITYYLDGEEIAPQDLAGKSGRLKMRFDYINHAKQEVMIGGKQESIYTPFGMVTGVLLPVDRVKNLEVTNGQVISDGSQQIAVGMAFPGLRESLGLTDTEENARDWGELQLADYVEMEADVTDFELAMTITAASPDLLKQLLEEGSKQEQEHDLDSVKDGVKELTDASARLAEGSQEVAEGSQELADGSRELAEGSKNLVSGSKELENGSKKLESGSREIKTGADTLVEKTGELATGAADLHSGIAAYTTGVSELADGIAALGDGTTALTTGSDTLDAGIGELKNGADALVAGYEGEHGAVAGAKTLAAGLEQLSQATASGGICRSDKASRTTGARCKRAFYRCRAALSGNRFSANRNPDVGRWSRYVKSRNRSNGGGCQSSFRRSRAANRIFGSSKKRCKEPGRRRKTVTGGRDYLGKRKPDTFKRSRKLDRGSHRSFRRSRRTFRGSRCPFCRSGSAGRRNDNAA